MEPIIKYDPGHSLHRTLLELSDMISSANVTMDGTHLINWFDREAVSELMRVIDERPHLVVTLLDEFRLLQSMGLLGMEAAVKEDFPRERRPRLANAVLLVRTRWSAARHDPTLEYAVAILVTGEVLVHNEPGSH